MRKLHNRTSILFGVTLTLLFATAGQGRTPVDPVNQDGKGVAIKGYDAVAYFKQSAPVKGSPQFTHQWMGATWLFASAEDRDLFAANPEQYAPRYGGYCAYAVSENHTAGIDPEAWKIVDGKLYLNYSKGVQKKWQTDAPGRIERGDKNWPGLHK
jgi:YHS domain-containing protein